MSLAPILALYTRAEIGNSDFFLLHTAYNITSCTTQVEVFVQTNLLQTQSICSRKC